MLRRILLILLLIFGVIQFFHPDKNTDNSETADTNDISRMMTVPANVQEILQKSCYDCHSNNTNYPWYAEIQPVSWWLNNHIKEGKSEVNFNEFSTYGIRRQYKKLEEIIEQAAQDIEILVLLVVRDPAVAQALQDEGDAVHLAIG
ncbi:MAG: heme-binding domain-containing protein, partial [Bacteroidota bacterium]